MKCYVTEDERWPTIVAHKATDTELKSLKSSIYDVPPGLIERLTNVHKSLELIENQIRMACGMETDESDSWFLSS